MLLPYPTTTQAPAEDVGDRSLEVLPSIREINPDFTIFKNDFVLPDRRYTLVIHGGTLIIGR
jgi:hypothetical protein